MKHPITLAAALALLVVTGCKTGNPQVTRALVATAVSTGVAIGVHQSPQAVPYLKAATPIVCAAAASTNLDPAVVVSAIQGGADPSLKTPEAVLILNGALGLYTVLWDSYGADAVKNQVNLQAWLQGTCDGLNAGLAGTATMKLNLAPKSAVAPKRLLPPHVQ